MAHETAAAKSVRVIADVLIVELRDGRTLSVPLKWYPRLAEGTPGERRRWELIGPGIGIHWPDLDEDVSVEALLNGLSSNESTTSLQRWRASRRAGARRASTSRFIIALALRFQTSTGRYVEPQAGTGWLGSWP